MSSSLLVVNYKYSLYNTFNNSAQTVYKEFKIGLTYIYIFVYFIASDMPLMHTIYWAYSYITSAKVSIIEQSERDDIKEKICEPYETGAIRSSGAAHNHISYIKFIT